MYFLIDKRRTIKSQLNIQKIGIQSKKYEIALSSPMDYMNESLCNDTQFERFYSRHTKSVRNYIYYKCGNLEQANDLVQEAFIKLWQNCKNIIPEKALAFVYKLSKRLMLNYIRHNQIVLRFEKSSFWADRNTHSPQHALEEAEFADSLEKAIGRLPEPVRLVFLMNRIDKYTYDEIAKILGLSVKTIEKRMHQALVALKAELVALNFIKI